MYPCDAFRERHIGDLIICRGSQIHSQIDHADLGTVAVPDDDFIPLRNEIRNGFRGVLHQLQLVFRCVAQSIAAQSQNQTFCHSVYSSFLHILFAILPQKTSVEQRFF